MKWFEDDQVLVGFKNVGETKPPPTHAHTRDEEEEEEIVNLSVLWLDGDGATHWDDLDEVCPSMLAPEGRRHHFYSVYVEPW